MNKQHARDHFATRLTHDNEAGCAALELHKTTDGKSDMVARVVFWDASGQFYLEATTDELPLVIVEELIAEAKDQIRTG